jgi:hypothetical protein
VIKDAGGGALGQAYGLVSGTPRGGKVTPSSSSVSAPESHLFKGMKHVRVRCGEVGIETRVRLDGFGVRLV